MDALKKFLESRLVNGYFPEIFNVLLFRSILRMCIQNWKFVALPVSEIIGVLKKIRQSLDTLTFPSIPNFQWAFVRIYSLNIPDYWPNFKFLSRSWDNKGYSKSLSSPWIRPRSLFSKIFNGLLFGCTL